ncbi:MAG TPA: quinone-dependent dihydroorotate dehydrogenase [Bacteroidia bacterium]|jgi:dihydroorotate dehydrogenase|nr:quinone-dependent dihydroorotate dehydrogenase [Bacteroidia bacterium]
MYKVFLRPIFFLFDPEKIHHFVFASLKFLFRIPGVPAIFRGIYQYKDPRLEVKLFGLTFSNPVGLAAGFDKDAKLFDELGQLGFGFVEIGTVTPKPQDGNPKKRMFRLKKDQGLINRMGFNNEGAAAAAKRLAKRKTKIVVGGNIGKNKITPNEKAGDDYDECFETLYPVVDFFVVNVSSPNTPGLRELQEKGPLKELLLRLKKLNAAKPKQKSILLKIAPDLTNEQLNDIIEIVNETKIDGVVATNTTISRAGLQTPPSELQTIGAGGLSGKPLGKRSTEVIRYLSEKSNKAFPIIGVGGINSAEDAIEKLEAGASLVQVYTGFIYQGPGIAKKICKEIVRRKKSQ